MTIETLKKRIAGKESAIASLEKKINRIEEAKATNWEKNPYYYNEHDLKQALKDLEASKNILARYQKDLEIAEEKANSRNVKPLVDFLEMWKTESIKYFRSEKERYEVAKAEYHAKRQLLVTNKDRRALSFQFQQDWMHVTQFNHGALSWEETLEKDLEEEKNRKYDDIIERTNAIVGQITDASNLTVGAKQDLNGFVIGTKGNAKIETIGAGGYNCNTILDSGRKGQRFHFRTLIHKIG